MGLERFEEEEEETEPMSSSPKRPTPLHNFNLPTWGTQRSFRCINAAANDGAEDSTSSRHSFLRSDSMESESTAIANRPSGGSEPLVKGISVVRDEMDNTETLKSWSQKMMKQTKVMKAPITSSSKAKRDFTPPVRMDSAVASGNVSSRLRSIINTNKIERPKLSVPLLRNEIAEDFVAMFGRGPRQRPRKRPRNVQKQLNNIFPGLWLSEVNAEMYEVVDTNQNGRKRRGKGKCFDDEDDESD